MQGHTASAEAEDIETVLGRFQAWAGSREPTTPKDGVREISYEEALESSRYRWKRHDETVCGNDTEKPASAEPGVVDVDERAAPHAAGTKPAATRSRRDRREGQQFRKALAQSIASRSSVTGLPGVTGPAGTTGLARTRGGVDRQVSLSLRVGASEQALIRIRAAEAGISVSAYLRQCALDVEILRAQVQQFMVASARGRLELSEASRAPAVQSEGWFSRWQRRIWGARSTRLSLKA
jgi:hypothetical protein